MLRVSTSRFPTNVEVQNESGVVWGALVMPLAPIDAEEGSGGGANSLRKRLSVVSSSSEYLKLSPVKPPASYVASDSSRPKSEVLDRCENCGAYISKVCRIVTVFWRCSLCGRRNNLGLRYTSVSDVMERLSLEELAKDAFEADAEELGKPEGSGYVFIIDLCGSDEQIEMVREATIAAIQMLGEEDAVGIIAVGSETVALLDTYQMFTYNPPLFKRVGISKDGQCRVPLSSMVDSQRWLRRLRGDGKALILAGVRSMQRCTAHRSKMAERDDSASPALFHVLRSFDSMLKGIAANTAVLRCFVVLGKPYSFSDHDRSGVTPARKDPIGIMIDVAALDLENLRKKESPKIMDTLRSIVRPRGGSIYLSADGAELKASMCLSLERPVALCGIMRIRTSPQFRITESYGYGIIPDMEVDDMFRIHSQGTSHTVGFGFEFAAGDGFFGNSLAPCIQVALRCIEMRPGWKIRRVLRVQTVQISTDQSATAMRKESDASVVFSLLARKAVDAYSIVGPEVAQDLLITWLTELIGKASRSRSDAKAKSPGSSDSAFVDRMSRLIFGVTKTTMLSDEYENQMLEKLPPEWLAVVAYPRLLGFSENEAGIYAAQPKDLHLSHSAVLDSGSSLFIVDAFTTIALYLYTPAASVAAQSSFPPSEDAVPMQVVRRLRRNRPVLSQLLILRSENPEDAASFKSFLIEDSTSTSESVHVEIESGDPNSSKAPQNSFNQFMDSIRLKQSNVVTV